MNAAIRAMRKAGRVQVEQYFKRSVAEWVDDNWRDWA